MCWCVRMDNTNVRKDFIDSYPFKDLVTSTQLKGLNHAWMIIHERKKRILQGNQRFGKYLLEWTHYANEYLCLLFIRLHENCALYLYRVLLRYNHFPQNLNWGGQVRGLISRVIVKKGTCAEHNHNIGILTFKPLCMTPLFSHWPHSILIISCTGMWPVTKVAYPPRPPFPLVFNLQLACDITS